jgi:hypothetical protein
MSAPNRPPSHPTIDAILAAPAFDAAAVDALATRERYADAAGYLQHVTRADKSLVPLMIEPNHVFAAYRLAILFKAITFRTRVETLWGVEDLRALRSLPARLALFALGEPIDWKSAGHRERAVFALRHLVRAMQFTR